MSEDRVDGEEKSSGGEGAHTTSPNVLLEHQPMELDAGQLAAGDLQVLVGVFAQERGGRLLQAEAAVEVRVIDVFPDDGVE